MITFVKIVVQNVEAALQQKNVILVQTKIKNSRMDFVSLVKKDLSYPENLECVKK
jgi:hypothetical protein